MKRYWQNSTRSPRLTSGRKSALTQKINQKIDALEERLNTEILAAEKRIKANRQQALTEMEVIARDMTGEVVKKVAGGRKPAIKTIEKALNDSA